MKKQTRFLQKRAKISDQYVLKFGVFCMLAFLVLDILSGNVPTVTLSGFAMVAYYWRSSVTELLGEEKMTAVRRKASELSLRVIIVLLFIGFFISFRVETIHYSLQALMYYGLALVFGLKAACLWFFHND